MTTNVSYRLCTKRSARRRERADHLVRMACLILVFCTHAQAVEVPAQANPEVAVMPKTCHGHANDAIYVALGEDLFRVPGTPDRVGIYPIPYPKSGETPPAATGDAPPGCPDHPAKAFRLNLSMHQASLLSNTQGFPSNPLESVNVARVGHRPYGELSAMDSLVMMVKRHPCREVGGGLVECTAHPDQKQGGSVLSAQASVYGTPLNHPFIVECGFGPGIWASDCQVHYQLSDDLVLLYRLNRDRIPAARMIALDQAIRAGVLRLLVKPKH